MSEHEQPDHVPASNLRPTGLASDWASRADDSARAVTRSFGHRLLFLPGTHIGSVALPSNRLWGLVGPWHYWWQAHYVDCLVDAGRRELATGVRFDGGSRPSAGSLASQLVGTIRMRNFFRFVNSYYDDMAWLALSALRLEELARDAGKPGQKRYETVRRSLTPQLESASTDDLGGGTFWSTKRDFKNTPATAPVALYFARTAHRSRAQSLVDWLNANLLDPQLGLYQDGLHLKKGQTTLEDRIYTYNQGPVLGALLELGGEHNRHRARQLVEAVNRELTVPGTHVIRGEGSGDGGLFTGILLRYLALAARDERLGRATRSIARTLVHDTAEAFWDGRNDAADRPQGHKHVPSLVFSPDPLRPAKQTYPDGVAVELSTQLQAWMAFEAAATL
ncbi:glycoside hydrolase family 76 protein [Arthrobacter sp. efr-133-TYG-104]|uniref:glycoside hydrolase family 76 protein n=1 Tax=Arthrobacter sp. efr-133-TYG-104 TaxID=3040324 RepID=UPI002550E278|nr:glycoside hydrolase family 76 protein [Arthrobacter sp. efr-133-TYG-104]